MERKLLDKMEELLLSIIKLPPKGKEEELKWLHSVVHVDSAMCERLLRMIRVEKTKLGRYVTREELEGICLPHPEPQLCGRENKKDSGGDNMNKTWKFRIWEVVVAIFAITLISYCSGYSRGKTGFTLEDTMDQPACVMWYDAEHKETNIVWKSAISPYSDPDPLYSNANIQEKVM